jgi:hypothetical protein
LAKGCFPVGGIRGPTQGPSSGEAVHV